MKDRLQLAHQIFSTSQLDAGIPVEPLFSIGTCNGEPLPLIQPNRLIELCNTLQETGLTIEQLGNIILGDQFQGYTLDSLQMTREEALNVLTFQVAVQTNNLSDAEKATIRPFFNH